MPIISTGCGSIHALELKLFIAILILLGISAVSIYKLNTYHLFAFNSEVLGTERLIIKLLKVIIPAIKTGIFTGAMLAFTMSIDDFVISYFVSGPDNANFSTWFYARRRMSKTNSVQYAAAYNTLLTLITITCLIVYNIIKNKKEKKKK